MLERTQFYHHAEIGFTTTNQMAAVVAQNTAKIPRATALHAEVDENGRPVKYYLYVWPSQLAYDLDHALIDYLVAIEKAAELEQKYKALQQRYIEEEYTWEKN